MKRVIAYLSLGILVALSACQSATPTPTATALPPTLTPTAAPATPTATAVAPTEVPTVAGPCTNLASFVADVTVPDYTHFDKRAAFVKTWRVKNVGTCSWTSDYKAAYSRGDALGAPASIALSDTAPGATLDISANMTAPAIDGKFEIFYQLTDATGDPMQIDAGDSIWALITVGKYIASAPPTPAPAPTSASGSGGSTSTSGPGLATISCTYQGNATFLSQMVTLINAARAANSLPPLTSSDKLNAAAQNHSADMACNNFLSHTGWNGSTPDSRIAAAGYSASLVRENIYGQPPQYGGNPQAAMDWWMSDPTHQAAILNAQVTQIGVGYASYSRSDLVGYFTVDFGAP